jgi:hypothetical protein
MTRAPSAPTKGFDVKRDGIERGEVETVEYDSTAAGGSWRNRLYVFAPLPLPPAA